MPATRSHNYNFSFYSVPTIDELLEELAAAKQVMGGNAQCRFKVSDSQRDGYSVQSDITPRSARNRGAE